MVQVQILIFSENALQCSESLVSSTPSDDSQGTSQPTLAGGSNLVSQVENVVKEGSAQGMAVLYHP